MISAIRINNGFATELPGFSPGCVFQFTPKLNVLFGQNGSGKSTILKIIKSYCGIPQEKGGWSRVNHPLALGATHKSHFPWVYKEFSPGHCEADVVWDGTPTFFNEGDTKIDKWAWFTHKDISSEDGMSSEVDHMNNLVDNPSSGQYRIKKMNKLFNLLKTPPNILEYEQNSNSQQISEVDYFRSLPRTGKVTLLLDEPERALSVPKQRDMFKLLQDMSEDYQIIIATHSPFVLFGVEGNFINLEEGYDQKCIEIFKECVEGIKG